MAGERRPEVLFLGDDAEQAIAIGWVGKRAFRRVLIAHDIEEEWARLDTIEHGWAVAATFGNDEVGFEYVKADTPEAFKATWWFM